MILSELLNVAVQAGDDQLGVVVDVRFELDHAFTRSSDRPPPPARLYGLIVSPHSRGSFRGYERSDVHSPWPIFAYLRWRQRGTFLLRWPDIEEMSTERVVVRPGYRRWSPVIDRAAAVQRPDPR